jgi:transcriptional regulator with XRE-family HTH domain
MELLAIAVKRDRERLGISQRHVDELAAHLASEMGVRLTSTWCGQIERCVSRDVSANERRLLARCLQQPENRYYGLETNPRTFIGRLLAKKPAVAQDALTVLERSIIFPPEYKQSGVSILSYFAEVVAKKYPDQDVRVTILQSGPTVTLRVETPQGDIEEIERTLEQYGLVVTGKMPIDTFTDDRELIRDL